MRNRGIGRGRMFMGGMLLFAAVIVLGTSLMMSPHQGATESGLDHVRASIAIFIRNSAIGTLILAVLAGYLLFPQRRPRAPRRDWLVGGLLALVGLAALYQLLWVQTSVLG